MNTMIYHGPGNPQGYTPRPTTGFGQVLFSVIVLFALWLAVQWISREASKEE